MLLKSLCSEYDENFAPMSLDEAYMDITDYLLMNQNKDASTTVQVTIVFSCIHPLPPPGIDFP